MGTKIEIRWTIVYLPERGRYFRPIANAVVGSWKEARDQADELTNGEAGPVAALTGGKGEIWYVPVQGSDVCEEDRDNVLIGSRRVPIRWDASPVELGATAAPKSVDDAMCPDGCEGMRPDGSHIHAGDADALLLDFHTFDESDPHTRPKRYDEPKRIVAQPAGHDRFGNPLPARVYLIDRQPELWDGGKARIFAENRTAKRVGSGHYFTPEVVLAGSILKAHPHHPEGFCTLASCAYSRARLELARARRSAS